MSTHSTQTDRSTAADYRDDLPNEGTRHSREDAVDARTFEYLVESTYAMDDYYGLQCRFILFAAGRLGMRAGEIAHMDESWIDWRRSMIVVPRHDPCTKGRDGGICGVCKQHIEQKADVRSRDRYEQAHADLRRHDELEPGGGRAAEATIPAEDLYESGWTSKTEAAAREIPFDSVTRAGIVVERFFDRFAGWPQSQQAINRRVDRMAEAAEGIDDDALYPHALRATAATFWADHSLNSHSLKGLMGWAQLSTSRSYIQQSGQRTAEAMRDATI